MGIARSSYYAAPEAKGDDTALVEAMAAICAEFEATAGAASRPHSGSRASSQTTRRSSA